jgi:hypothetical protein
VASANVRVIRHPPSATRSDEETIMPQANIFRLCHLTWAAIALGATSPAVCAKPAIGLDGAPAIVDSDCGPEHRDLKPRLETPASLGIPSKELDMLEQRMCLDQGVLNIPGQSPSRQCRPNNSAWPTIHTGPAIGQTIGR